MQVIGNLCGLCFRLIHLISNILVHLEILHLLICTALTACKSNSTKSYHDCVVLALTVGDALGEYIYIYLLILPGQLGTVPLIVFSVQLPWDLLTAQPEALEYDMLTCHAMHASLGFQQLSFKLCH